MLVESELSGLLCVMGSCYHCATAFPAEFVIARATECPNCGRDVRVCKNCKHYAPGSHWDCHESIPDQVVDKERANFCDYFSLAAKETDEELRKQNEAKLRKARAGFAALFNDTPND